MTKLTNFTCYLKNCVVHQNRAQYLVDKIDTLGRFLLVYLV